jgi:hypothetical protein
MHAKMTFPELKRELRWSEAKEVAIEKQEVYGMFYIFSITFLVGRLQKDP